MGFLKRFLGVSIAILFFAPSTGQADLRQIGPNYFVAGISTAEFEYFSAPDKAGVQRQANWCWAATIQMVLNFHGLHVTQEQIVSRIYGSLADKPGDPSQMLIALSGWAPDFRGGRSLILASPYILQGSDIVRDLGFKWPIIVGLSRPGQVGHAYVLTAVYYAVGDRNQPIFDKVVLRDPWPGAQSRIEMPWGEFQSRLTFAARVYVERQ